MSDLSKVRLCVFHTDKKGISKNMRGTFYNKPKIGQNGKFLLAIIFMGIGFFYYVLYLLLYVLELEEINDNSLKRPQYFDDQYKMEIIKESVKLLKDYNIECKPPEIPIYNPEIMQFYYNTSALNCGSQDDDWVICEKSLCFVKPNVKAIKGEITCSYTDLIRKNDHTFERGKSQLTNGNYILQKSDFAKVFCTAENGDRWLGIVIGVRDSVKRQNSNPQPLLNILILGFDSLSRNAIIRKLPNTYDYLTKDLNGIVLKGYNIIGDGTPKALIPILTGHEEIELPQTGKHAKDTNFVNIYPMIWKDYEKNGYITSFNEDIPKTGTFTYRLSGFNEQPTDHYMRTFYIAVENYIQPFMQYCISHQPAHQTMLNYTKNILVKYNKNPSFIFSFHGELSHGSINDIGLADDDIKNWMVELRDKGILDNTLLIVMSDHGNRFGTVRNTLQGKQEERLPFFSFTFPSWFKAKFNKEYKNLAENADRLTTPFDIHETLIDILRIQSLQPLPLYQQKIDRAFSLFKPIPKTRSCSDAYIEPHYCACLYWQPINDTSSIIVKQVANSIVDKINTLTLPYRHMCELLELQEINWALKLVPHDHLLQYKKNLMAEDLLGDLTLGTKLNMQIYQAKITVVPGSSIFEASVTRNLNTNKFYLKSSDISRINMYGSQAKCVYNSNPEMRKYCFCKK